MGATVPDYHIENQPQSNVNIEEGVDDNGNNEENWHYRANGIPLTSESV